MLKRTLKYFGYTFIILLALFACARFIDVSLGGIYDGDRAPYIQSLGSDSAIIRWNTKKPQRGVVAIGEQLQSLNKVFSETKVDDEHEVRLTGLKPGTRYYYSVGAQSHSIYSGAGFWFQTAPLQNAKNTAPLRFWVTGDQGQAGLIQNQVRDAMLSWVRKNPLGKKTKPDFWLTTGDNAYRSGTNKQFQQNFFRPYADILKNTPVWPVYGNHDARRWAFYNIFSFPVNGEAGGVASHTEKYYSFDYGSVHVIVLDTQSSRIQPGAKMLRWLKKDLAVNKSQWLVAVFHHPAYSKGSHNSDNLADSLGRMHKIRKYILPLLEQAGADVVLSGHSHMYERSWFMRCHYAESDTFSKRNIVAIPNKAEQIGATYNKTHKGTVYITIGSSARLDNGELDHPAMPVSLHQSGSLVFDIISNKLSANFITRDGTIADNFSIVKNLEGYQGRVEQCR